MASWPDEVPMLCKLAQYQIEQCKNGFIVTLGYDGKWIAKNLAQAQKLIAVHIKKTFSTKEKHK